jgi:hypothetical protein
MANLRCFSNLEISLERTPQLSGSRVAQAAFANSSLCSRKVTKVSWDTLRWITLARLRGHTFLAKGEIASRTALQGKEKYLCGFPEMAVY